MTQDREDEQEIAVEKKYASRVDADGARIKKEFLTSKNKKLTLKSSKIETENIFLLTKYF